MNRLLRTFAAASCIAALLNACGGGGGGGTSTPATPPSGDIPTPTPVALHAEAIAGMPTQPPRYANGTLATAQFYMPGNANFPQMAFDQDGNLYVFDANYVIRKITPPGSVSLLAGTVGQPGAVDGTGAGASFEPATGMATDASGNVYLSSQTAIRKITPAGVVTTFAGKEGTTGQQDGAGAKATFYSISGLATDSAGNLYVADYGLRRVSPSGMVTTVMLEPPNPIRGVAIDPKGNITLTDGFQQLLRYDTTGKLLQRIGLSDGTVTMDGTAAQSHFNEPWAFAYAPDGMLYVLDRWTTSNSIRTVDPAGNVATLHSGLLDAGLVDGPVATARLGGGISGANSIATDKEGNVFIADVGNHAIRKLSPAGQVTTYTGGWTAPAPFADGPGTAATFRNIRGFATDKAGNFYVADGTNCAIRKITPQHVVTTLAGVGEQCDYTVPDGTGPAARFWALGTMTQGADGSLYVAEQKMVRKVTLAGVVTTVAGAPFTTIEKDGTGANASFLNLQGIAMGPDGNLIVSDGFQQNGDVYCSVDMFNVPNWLRTVTPAGVVSTIPNSGWSCVDRDKAPAIWGAENLVFDNSGNLYLVSGNYISKRAPDGTAAYLLDSQGNKVAAEQLAPDDAGNVFFTLAGAVYKYGADHLVTKVVAPTAMSNPVAITPDVPVTRVSALTYIGNHKFLASFDDQVVMLTLH